jgi:hypothetical protein
MSDPRNPKRGGSRILAGEKPRLTGLRCCCGACRQTFNSVTAFDTHRTGDYGNRGANRRCLTEAEMVAKGMSRNRLGYWISKARETLDPGPDRAAIGGLRVGGAP